MVDEVSGSYRTVSVAGVQPICEMTDWFVKLRRLDYGHLPYTHGARNGCINLWPNNDMLIGKVLRQHNSMLIWQSHRQ